MFKPEYDMFFITSHKNQVRYSEIEIYGDDILLGIFVYISKLIGDCNYYNNLKNRERYVW